jgi:hypothetical protein
MPDRLVLNTVGIKSPLDVRGPKREKKSAGALARLPAAASSPRGEAGPSTTRRRRALNPKPIISPARRTTGKAPKLTAIALDEDLAQKLDSTAGAAGVSATGLAVAALDAALAKNPKAVRVIDRRRRARPTRRRTLPLPPHLRSRADRLSATVDRRRSGGPGTARSEVINTAIRRGLPDSPRLALALVIVAATAPPRAV